MTRVQKRVVIGKHISLLNKSATPLGIGGVFNGTYEGVFNFNTLVVACRADKAGTLQVYQSDDGVIDDSTLSFDVAANTNEVHRVVLTRLFYKLKFTNTSGEVQTVFRLSSQANQNVLLTAPKNLSVQQDADSILVRPSDYYTEVVLGKYEGHSLVPKFGRNPAISQGTVPEDIWNGGGLYTGFPTGAAEEFQVVSDNVGDTGVLTFTYLASSTSTAWQTASVTLNGTTPVNTGVTGIRMHTARYASGGATTFNLGTIEVRHRTTTANVFCRVPIGRSQTYVAVYTIPAGHTGVLKRTFCRVVGAVNGYVNGALWIRTNGGSPRLRRPFSAALQDGFEERYEGGIPIEEKSDIKVHILEASTNGLDVLAGFDLELIKN